MTFPLRILFPASALAIAASALPAQTVPPPNYDEGKVPHYTLPDPLVLNDGQRVTDAATWREKRRPEVLRLFEQYVYGKAPRQAHGVAGPRPARSIATPWAARPSAKKSRFTFRRTARDRRSICSSISPRKPTVQALSSWA